MDWLMITYYFQCPKNHVISFNFNKLAYEKFLRLCSKGLRVCPECKPENQFLTECSELPKSNLDYRKPFVCKDGHMNYAYLFSNGIINLTYNDQYKNFIDLTPDSFLKKILSNKIKCLSCKKKLRAADTSPLMMPEVFNIKTKTRLGDVWKNIEPKEKIVDSDGIIQETAYGKAVKQRIQKLRKERLTRMAGKPLNRSTKNSYKESNDQKPTKKDLNGD